MVDQPGAGNSNTYKIRAHTSRQRHTAKPYARPSERKKSVLETVKDFLAPSWLVGLFQKKETDSLKEEGDAKLEKEHANQTDTNEEILNRETFNEQETHVAVRKPIDKIKIGNGQLQTSRGSFSTYSYYSPNLQRQKMVNDFPSTSWQTDLDILEERRRFSREDRNDSRSFAAEPGSEQESSSYGLRDEGRPKLDHSVLQDSVIQQITKPSQESTIKGLSTSKLVSSKLGVRSNSSPFYPGKTSYGGASSGAPASKRMRTSGFTPTPQTYQPVKMQVKPKPVFGVSNTGVTSQTAKRILESLEKMSSPLIDAKKVPAPPSTSTSDSPLSFLPAKRKAPTSAVNRVVGSPKCLKAHFSGPPVLALSTPQRASISRTSPKDTEECRVVFPTASANASVVLTEPTAIPVGFRSSVTASMFTRPTAAFTSTPLPVSLLPVTKGASPKGGGKMKAARNTGHYSQRGREEEEEEIVNPLPEVTSGVALTLANGKSLPTFSFGISAHSTPMPSNPTLPSLFVKPGDVVKNNFKFSAPATKAPSLVKAENGSSDTDNKVKFSFSQPVPISRGGTRDSNSVVDEKKNEVKKSVYFGSNEVLKTFGSWECDTCFIINKASDSKCIACSAPKPRAKPLAPRPSQPPTAELIETFAPPVGSWSCETCLVNNTHTDEKCVACQTSRPTSKEPASNKSLSASELIKTFAPAAGSWTCGTCLVSNKASVQNCVACQTPKSGETLSNVPTPSLSKGGLTFVSNSQDANNNSDLAKKFAPPAGSWTCDTCMVSNKVESVACVACTTPKPGSKPAGSTGFSSLGGFNDGKRAFGTGNSSSDANKTKPTFTFGGPDLDVKDSSTPAFKFGGQSLAAASSESKVLPCTFGVSSPSGSSNSISVSFGSIPVNKGESAKEEGKVKESGTSVTASFTLTGAAGALKKKDESRPKSIAEAAASGLLRIPTKTDTGKSTTAEGSPSKHSSIAEAIPFGLLEVPGARDKKEDTALPPNVNLFGTSATKGAGPSLAAGANQFKLPESTTGTPSLGTNPAAFSFGVQATSKLASLTSIKPVEASSSALPVFGISSTPAEGFSFAAPASSASIPTSSSSQFSFVATPGTSDQPNNNPLVAGVFGASTTSSSDTSSKPAFTGMFGASAATGNVATTSTTGPSGKPFAFTLVTTTSPAVVSPFMAGSIGAPSTNTTTPSFSFNGGAVVKTTTESSSTAAFTFPPISSSKTADVGAKPAFSFTASTGLAAAAPAGPFQFGGTAGSSDTAKTNQFTFGSAQSTGGQPFVFGGGSGSTAVPTPVAGGVSDEIMDADGNSNQGPVAPFSFGAKTGSNVFGAGTSSSSGSIFGSGLVANATGAAPAFDATATNSTAAVPRFGTGTASVPAFGSSATTTATTGFAFGTAQATSSGFNFVSNQPNPVATSPFVFGGGSNVAQAFGGQSVAAPTPATDGFNFSAPAANLSSSGFNFMAGGSQGVTPAFTPGTPGDSSGVTSSRKIKRAYRRSKR